MLLSECYPLPLDLQRLVILDYLLLHSGDLPDGPESIHPPSPLRAGEVAVRRQLLEQGLQLFATKGLIAREINSFGIRYVADETAPMFLDALSSPYAGILRDRAAWANEKAGTLSDDAATNLLKKTTDRWRTEFELQEMGDES